MFIEMTKNQKLDYMIFIDTLSKIIQKYSYEFKL